MQDFHKFFGDPLRKMDDLVAIGGDFSSDRLLYAYTHGIFPWSQNPIRWYCLHPRAIFEIDGLHVSKTVRKKIRQQVYKVTFNQAFLEVMRGCADRVNEITWITDGFIKGYTDLHKKGYAHSVEAWNEAGQLVGGAYGVAIGRFFAGESMFSKQSDAGKVALTYLFEALFRDGFTLFDTQQLNEVTWSLGAYEITKELYLDRLYKAVEIPDKWEPVSSLDTEKFLIMEKKVK
ncbi:MAG: leucyl/phenylalanyl-tRNA--protein transferase [Leptospiraceae bacterium]|nr:leucyl/phenylalanyl-tRNA--protein transferase [Leptospiraceae bacterium]